MTDNKPLVSIITLNYNQAALTLQLLESLQQLSYPNIEIIVCDMKSSNEQVAMLVNNSYANTKFFFSPLNLGFSGGNNWGVQLSRGNYLLFLNNDTEVEPLLVDKLLNRLLSSPEIGAVSPRINRFQNRNIIEYAGFHPMNFYTGRTKSVGFNKEESTEFNRACETASVHGCAMMMERKTFGAVGGFCEDYFLYYEEWDLSIRLKKMGRQSWYEPGTIVYHKDGQSIGPNNPLKEYYLTRNRILLMRRHASRYQLIIFIIFFSLFSLPATILRLILSGRLSQLRSFLKAVRWNLSNSSVPNCDLYTSQLC